MYLRFWALSVVVVVMGGIYHCHGGQDVEGIGWQVQIVQTRGNDRVLLTKPVRHRWFIRVIINCKNMWLRGCYRRDWWHSPFMVLWSLRWIEYVRRVVPSWTGIVGYLFYIEHVRVRGIKRDIRHYVTDRNSLSWRDKKLNNKIEATDISDWRLAEWSVLLMIVVHFLEAGIRLMFPRRCFASTTSRKSRVQLKLMRCKQISKWNL